MAAENRRAPRVARDRTNMSAAAASLRANIDFADAWAALWQAYGGTLHHDGTATTLGFTRSTEPVSVMIGNVSIHARDHAERHGALNALAALLRIVGRPAMDAVFAHAASGRPM